MRKWGYWGNVKMCKYDGTTVLAFPHFRTFAIPHSHIFIFSHYIGDKRYVIALS